jgi:hypothetical protein
MGWKLEADMEITGSCSCNAVQFKVNGAPNAVVNCHCKFCRKHSGAAFSTYVVAQEAALEITSGLDVISAFQFKEDSLKHFCKQCGSPIFNKNARYPGMYMIYLGGISEAANIVPTANIYCESQLAWVPAIAEIRNFAQGIAKQAKS